MDTGTSCFGGGGKARAIRYSRCLSGTREHGGTHLPLPLLAVLTCLAFAPLCVVVNLVGPPILPNYRVNGGTCLHLDHLRYYFLLGRVVGVGSKEVIDEDTSS